MTHEERLSIARRAARRYAYLKWIDLEEAAQEALAAMLEAERRAGPEIRNLKGYLMSTALYAVRWFVWTATSPVTHSDRGTVAQEATQLRRDCVDEQNGGQEEMAQHLEDRDWEARVRARFAELCAKDAEIDQVIAHLCLLHEHADSDVAQSENVTPRSVYVVTQRVRNRIFKDAKMLALLNEKLTR